MRSSGRAWVLGPGSRSANVQENCYTAKPGGLAIIPDMRVATDTKTGNAVGRDRTPKGQEGGVTILVALSLLALLTVAALGMSKNSFREIRTSGFLKQGAMARNVADSGLHWSIYWMDLADSADAAAQKLISLKSALAGDNALSGRLWNINAAVYRPGGPLSSDGVLVPGPSSSPDFRTGLEADYEQGFTIGLMRMGKLPVTDMSQGSGAGAFAPAAGGAAAQAPDLWAIRSEAQVRPAGAGITFTHAKEAWVSTPAR
jgi:hypothetical protein